MVRISVLFLAFVRQLFIDFLLALTTTSQLASHFVTVPFCRRVYGRGVCVCVCWRHRLWAEIFEVQEDNGDICWGRVSDDVVPVNITCVQSQPTTVFQITAYNRHVEKIFDVRIIQPGSLQRPPLYRLRIRCRML